ncbi:MAG: DUF5924 family protein [Polyangiaceae bacterium]
MTQDGARPPAPAAGGAAPRPPDPRNVRVVPPTPFAPSPVERGRAFLAKHARKLWWLHSAYALGLGVSVVVFAQRGFDHARWLAVSGGIAWLLVVVFFRVFGEPRERSAETGARARVGFFVMTYALKNLYQGMLFFLLPFYYKSTTLHSANGWFVVLLAACALVSTLDIVFDRVVFRVRALASIFHGFTLFACMNLVVPALVPDTRTRWSLGIATFFAVLAFWTIHVKRLWVKSPRVFAAFLASAVAATLGVHAARAAIPPVPMYVSKGAVGPLVLDDGTLGMEVQRLHPTVIDKLIAITDVVVPGGRGDGLRHVWRHDGDEVHRASEGTSRVAAPHGVVRLRSALSGRQISRALVGTWSVDVETDDGQLVGRVTFVVSE